MQLLFSSKTLIVLTALSILHPFTTNAAPQGATNAQPQGAPQCPAKDQNGFWSCVDLISFVSEAGFLCLSEAVFTGLNPVALGLCAAECVEWGPAAFILYVACFGTPVKIKRDEISVSNGENNYSAKFKRAEISDGQQAQNAINVFRTIDKQCFQACSDCHPGGPRQGDQGVQVNNANSAAFPVSPS